MAYKNWRAEAGIDRWSAALVWVQGSMFKVQGWGKNPER